ncbi:MAG: carbamoyltransferase HypF [Desulfovibrio sp.]|jgi:hydrogenase maturation protein HypF|nr:carbamoyltransferase HypF [Desulfovibrio sp.]
MRFIARGQVQGVGFRPFVFRLARSARLTGFVRNEPEGVRIEVQGKSEALEAFALRLEKEIPPLARLASLCGEEIPPRTAEDAFVILSSAGGSDRSSPGGKGHSVLVSPDISTCPDCFAEILDPANRRFAYPFTNCTACGPRYSIIRSIPYDRPATSMACFPLCPDCRAEYENPGDRRFHAQPNACPRCGPRLRLSDPRHSGQSGDEAGKEAGTGEDPLLTLARLLLQGKIAAVKGLGGFHLVCDAGNDQAVALLRQRKQRPHKALALMAADLREAGRIARIGRVEKKLLLAPERPIVICPLRARPRGQAPPLSGRIAPDTRSVGLMLPYTPLHILLLEHFKRLLREPAQARQGPEIPEPQRQTNDHSRPAVLVMTSGNEPGAPLCLGNREALTALSGLADVFLLHNRDILVRVDDSVLKARVPARGKEEGEVLFFRRARGYAPRPLPFAPKDFSCPCVLGAGADLKNTVCLTKGPEAFVSQHIGDLEHPGAAAFHIEARDHLQGLLQVEPELAVRDLHPDFQSSRATEDFAKERAIPLLALQHHFAHAHAVLGEHAFSGKALVMALDGHGYGPDKTFWGGEILYLDTRSSPVHRRLAHLALLDLPGGDAAARSPWRIAHALLLRLGLLKETERQFCPPWLPQRGQEAQILTEMLQTRINVSASSSCGRLFDAVSALLGLCLDTSYEGQAAILLEEAQGKVQYTASGQASSLYPCPCGPDPAAGNGGEMLLIDSHALFRALYEDLGASAPPYLVARRFHRSLAAGLAACAARLATQHGIGHVGLSGGCFQNLTLSAEVRLRLEKLGLEVLEHRLLPPGDGCISFGQAVYGALHWSASHLQKEEEL